MFSLTIQVKLLTKSTQRASLSIATHKHSLQKSCKLFPNRTSHDPKHCRNVISCIPPHRCTFSEALLVNKTSINYSVCYHVTAHLYNAYRVYEKMPIRDAGDHGGTSLHGVVQVIRFSCAEPNTLNANIVHGLALKLGALAHLPISTSLLTLYSRARDFGSSVTLFDEVLDKDVVFWNAMLSSCRNNMLLEELLNVFVKMVRDGNKYDATSLVIIVSGLSDLKILLLGQVLHCLSVKRGMLLDTLLTNALIDMYAKCGELSVSEFLFMRMGYRDLVSWNSIISGCLYNNHPEKSLWYFRQMAPSEKKADSVSISSAIAACTCLNKFDLGQSIHELGIKIGYCEGEYGSVSVANSLISFYSHFGEIDAVENVVIRMAAKDAITWNSMISAFALHGDLSEPFQLLHDMQFIGSVEPDSVTVVAVLPVCSEFGLVLEGKAVHGFVVRREISSEISVINCLLDMYSKCNHIKEAEYLFSSLPKKDLVSWNTMISGYANNGNSWEAQSLFKELLECCSESSLSTLLAILPSCNFPKSLQLGRSIDGWHLKAGWRNNIYAVNSLMGMYIACGDFPASFQLLHEISADADVTSWNTIISGCTQNGYFLEALKIFNLMRQNNLITHDSITLVNVISACGNLELASEGKAVHGIALKSSTAMDIRAQNALITMYSRFKDIGSAKLVFSLIETPNLCSWNCMISALSQNGDPKRALELFPCLDFEPDEITIASILSACSQLGAWRHGMQLHGRAIRFCFHHNSYISAALVDMYSSCSRLDTALKVFHTSPKKSTAAWNSMILAYGLHNEGKKANRTFYDMIESGISPSKSTFINLLSACGHCGLVDEGKWFYYNMFDKFSIQPVTEHHVCLVDMLGRSGRLDEARDFVESLPTKPEVGVWGAFLSACNYHGDLKMGREVADILFSLEPENVSYYVSIFNMYVAAGRWEEAAELRKIVQDKQLKKPTGFSCIDVGLS